MFTRIPKSPFSKEYERKLRLLPDDELKVLAQCPNGSCTNKVVIFSQKELHDAIEHALHSDNTFVIGKSCEGWEDAERTGKYHCNSQLILSGHILIARRNPSA